MIFEVKEEYEKSIIEEFFRESSNGSSNNNYDLRSPYESEFIIRYIE